MTLLLGVNAQPAWLTVAAAVLTVMLARMAYSYDQLRKTAVILFDMDTEIEALYQSLHNAFDNLSNGSAKWHIAAEGRVTDRKRRAGASTLIQRHGIQLLKRCPPYVKTNIAIPCIPVGNQCLYFFPDKVLVFDLKGVGAVSYAGLQIDVEPTRFIEDGAVPKDATVVDRTWPFVNKNGGPDRRFKGNRELPVVLYEDIHFRSATGLNERIEISRVGLGDPPAHSIRQWAAYSVS